MGFKPTCKEVHRLVSEELDRELSLVERVRVHLHIRVCDACRNFDVQMRMIRNAMRRFTIPAPDPAPDEDKGDSK